MKLRVGSIVPDMEMNADVSSVVRYGYISFLCEMDKSIKENLTNHLSIFDGELLIDIDSINGVDSDIEEEEKKLCLDIINEIRSSLNNGVDAFLKCFDTLEIVIDNIEGFDNLDKLIYGLDIPIILDVRDIDDSYLIENITEIDEKLKKNYKNKITYCIKQCMYENDAHYEDCSYSIDDVLLVLNFLDNIVNDVENYNFTVFEKIMYVYDIVKDRYFIEAAEGESYLESRDLARVFKSDKIVCFGFAMLFKSILDKLNIRNEIVLLNGISNPLIGHARNLVCVNDSKYELNHILYFDATWDCKKDDDFVDVNRYDNFARNKIYFVKKDWNKLDDYCYLPYFLRKDNDYSFLNSETNRKYRNIKKMFNMIDWQKYCIDSNLDEEFVEKFSRLMSRYPYVWFPIFSDCDFCVEAYKECCRMLERRVSNYSFLRCLYTVRRVQNHINPEKYNFDKDELISVYEKYIGLGNSREHQLMKLIFGTNLNYDKLEEFEKEDIADSREKLLSYLGILNNNINNLELDNNTSVKEAIKILKK